MKRISFLAVSLSVLVLLLGFYGQAFAAPLSYSLSHPIGTEFVSGDTLLIALAESQDPYTDVVFSVGLTIGAYDKSYYSYGSWEPDQIDKIKWTEYLDGSVLHQQTFKDFPDGAKFYATNITTPAVNYDGGVLAMSISSETSKSNETWRLDSVSVSGNSADASHTPLPSSLVLIGSGLAGFVGFRKKIRKLIDIQ